MVPALDHVALAVRDFEAVVDGYARLFGRTPARADGDGARRAWFHFPNMAFEIVAPDDEADGEGAAGDRVRARLEAAGEGQWLVALAVDDVEAAARLVARRGLAVAPAGEAAFVSAAGLDIVLTRPREAEPSAPTGPDPVAALDHVVVYSPNPDRAAGVYGAKLGMELRLDRANEKWGARQQFYRCGGAVFEVGASLKTPVGDGPDSFGGLAWRVDDPDAVRARLAAAGFNVSEVRPGRKPGTKVFTVRDAPAGVPTLMLSAEPQMERV